MFEVTRRMMLIAGVSSVVGRAASAEHGEFTYTFFDVPAAIHTFPRGINNRGQIVGVHQIEPTPQRNYSFLFDRSSFTTIQDPSPSSWVEAQAINDRGVIAGVHHAASTSTGFVWGRRGIRLIEISGAVYSAVFGLNNQATVVGAFLVDVGPRGFMMRGPVFETIDGPGALQTIANDVNDRNEMHGSDFVTIDHPESSHTYLQGINNRGDLVGHTLIDGRWRSFLRKDDRFHEIDIPGALEVYASDIDDTGRIVGSFNDGTHHRGFIADSHSHN